MGSVSEHGGGRHSRLRDFLTTAAGVALVLAAFLEGVVAVDVCWGAVVPSGAVPAIVGDRTTR